MAAQTLARHPFTGTEAVDQKQLDKALFTALSQKDLEACRTALRSGANPNSRDPLDYGHTALTRSIETNFLDGLRLLLEHGGATYAIHATPIPLHSAAQYNNPAACRILVDAGAVLNWKDEQGRTALHVAAFDTRLEACTELIDLGADVLALNSAQYTPLHLAVLSNFPKSIEIWRALIAAGIDPDLQSPAYSKTYLTPFQFAVRHAKTMAVEFFLTECGVNPDQTTNMGKTMLELCDQTDTLAVLRSAITTRATSKTIDEGQVDASDLARRRSSPLPL